MKQRVNAIELNAVFLVRVIAIKHQRLDLVFARAVLLRPYAGCSPGSEELETPLDETCMTAGLFIGPEPLLATLAFRSVERAAESFLHLLHKTRLSGAKVVVIAHAIGVLHDRAVDFLSLSGCVIVQQTADA